MDQPTVTAALAGALATALTTVIGALVAWPRVRAEISKLAAEAQTAKAQAGKLSADADQVGAETAGDVQDVYRRLLEDLEARQAKRLAEVQEHYTTTISHIQAENARREDGLRRELDALRAELNVVKDQLKAKNAETHNLEIALEAERGHRRDLDNKLRLAEGEIVILRAERETLLAQMAAMTAELSELRAKVDLLQRRGTAPLPGAESGP